MCPCAVVVVCCVCERRRGVWLCDSIETPSECRIWLDRSIRLHYVRNVNRFLYLSITQEATAGAVCGFRSRPAGPTGPTARARRESRSRRGTSWQQRKSSEADAHHHISSQQTPTHLIDRPTRPHDQHRWRRRIRGRGGRVRCQQQPGPEARVSAASRCDRRYVRGESALGK